MRSELKIQTPNIKLSLIVGLFATILVISLAIFFRFEVGLILLAVAGSVGLAGGAMATNRVMTMLHTKRLNGLELAHKQEEVRLIRAKADRAMLEAHVLSFPQGHRVVTALKPQIQVIEAPLPPLALPAIAETEAETVEPLPKLLDLIKTETSVIFTGPKRAGKTNCSLHWPAGRGQCIVADPKNEAHDINHWPTNCQVVGSLLDIQQAINYTLDTMHQRRKTGSVTELPLTLFFDEVHYLISEGVNVVETSLQIATLGAEFKVFAAFAAHAITAKYLDVSAAALLANFTVVRVSKIGGTYRTFLNQGEGEYQVSPPGEFTPFMPPETLRPTIVLSEDDKIVQMIGEGLSNYQICKQLWAGKRGGGRYERIDMIRQQVA